MPQSEDQALLAAYLKERRTPCPGCNYELRGLTTDHCPECNAPLELAIERKAAGGVIFWLLLLLFSWFLLGGAFNTARTARWVLQDIAYRSSQSAQQQLAVSQVLALRNRGIPLPSAALMTPAPTSLLDHFWYYTNIYSLRAVLMTLAAFLCIPALLLARRRSSLTMERWLIRFALLALVLYVGSGIYTLIRGYW